MPLKKEVIQKYMNNVFVESGSLVGEAIETALAVGFKKVLSVELAEKYYNICKNKFNNDPRVTLFFGDVELLESTMDVEYLVTSNFEVLKM
jgi:hypothetical protein